MANKPKYPGQPPLLQRPTHETMPGGVFAHNEHTIQTNTMPNPNIPAHEPDPFIGRVFNNKFEIKEQVGRGGIGLVYRAVQRGLNRDVVIKLLKQEQAQDVSTTQRFSREAQALSLLDHENIVGVYDFGQEGETSYIVMEYIDGMSMDAMLKQMGQVPLDVFAPVARQILDAVGEAHRLGIIHRDLKPSNVMLTSRKGFPYFVKVLDFGLVKLLSEESDLTGQHKLVGTIAYLSPEQILGSEADQRVDVYALGVLFYHMLAGQKPFKGRDMTVLYQHIHQPPTPLNELLPPHANVPPSLIHLIHRCLSKDPNDRPLNANALLDELGAAIGDPSLMAFPWTSGEYSHASIQALNYNPGDVSSPSWDRSSSDVIPSGINHNAFTDPSYPSHPSSPSHLNLQQFGSSQNISRPIPQLPDAMVEPLEPEAPVSIKSKVIVGIVAALALLALGVGAGLIAGDSTDEPSAKTIANVPKKNVPVEKKAPVEVLAVKVVLEGAVDAAVTIDGKPQGVLPKTLSLAPSTYSIKVIKEGFKPWLKTLKVEEGKPVVLAVSLEEEEKVEETKTVDPPKVATKKRTWRPKKKTTSKTKAVIAEKDPVKQPEKAKVEKPPEKKIKKKKKGDLLINEKKDDFELMD